MTWWIVAIAIVAVYLVLIGAAIATAPTKDPYDETGYSDNELKRIRNRR